jgi:hypothetical protein
MKTFKAYLTFKNILSLSTVVIAALTFSQAQADQVKTVYTGLACQPHYPQYDIGPNGNGNRYIYEYYGSEIINTMPDINLYDPADTTVTYNDLGVNCTIDRNLFGSTAKLGSVRVLLTDNSDNTVDTFNHSNCHTHIEYASAGTINVIFGDDVYAVDKATPDVYQTLNLPATVAAPTNDANYDIHCHIHGSYSVINGYTVTEKN